MIRLHKLGTLILLAVLVSILAAPYAGGDVELVEATSTPDTASEVTAVNVTKDPTIATLEFTREVPTYISLPASEKYVGDSDSSQPPTQNAENELVTTEVKKTEPLQLTILESTDTPVYSEATPEASVSPTVATEPLQAAHDQEVYDDEVTAPEFDGCTVPPYTERELEMITKTVWGEARGCATDEQRLVVWTIFQQVDADGDFAKYSTVAGIITKPYNFGGYCESNPLDPDIYAMVCEEAAKWANGEEPPTLEPYAPTLPYLFFDGDGEHNWFRAEWRR